MKEYYLGIDAGTESVGWAVTDENYELLRLKGQDAWGARLFDEAQNAQDRRQHRSARRNLQRRKIRLQLLQEIFAPAIDARDPEFFNRLKESQLYVDDKTVAQKNTLFNDQHFKDKDFHLKYKTVYHLIDDLINNGTKDPRLLYLGIHKLLKNRGHFLFNNIEVQEGQFKINKAELLQELNNAISVTLGEDFVIDFSPCDIFSIMQEKISLLDKTKKVKEQFVLNNQQLEIVNALMGRSTTLDKIFGKEEFLESEFNKFSMDKEDLDSYFEEIMPLVETEGVQLLEIIQKIYSWSVLSKIMNGFPTVSASMKHVYEQHKADLKLLKTYIKQFHKEDYDKLFNDVSKSARSYANYIKSYKEHTKDGVVKHAIEKTIELNNFYTAIKNIIKKDDNETAKEIKHRIEDLKDFLPKQVSKLNSYIPNQLRVAEIKLMLNKNKENFPFLSKRDDSGFTNAEKIVKLCEFRIPYYVGPLNDAHSIEKGGFAWIQKNSGYEKAKITPWNFDKIVNRIQSREAFMNHLIGSCTYLMGEKVLPKQSLINAQFNILNVINKIKLNYKPIDIELKQKLFQFLLLQRKITQKTVFGFFITEGKIGKNETNLVDGIDEDFNMSFTAYAQFHAILGDKTNSVMNQLEDIVLWATMLEDSSDRKEKIENQFSSIFTPEEIAKLTKLRFKDWAKLSKKFLTEIKGSFVNSETGEVLNLLQSLMQTNYNLQQLLYEKDFQFQKAVDTENEKFMALPENKNNGIYNQIQNSYVSVPVKRQIWQALEVVKEIIQITKQEPKKIFVEMARGESDKNRTKSRKKELIELYQSIHGEERDWVKEIENVPDHYFQSEKVILYYKQMGRCMYSGQPIGSMEETFNVNLYDIDHIYPQSKVKDDSLLNNLVLSSKICNSLKGDTMVPAQYRQAQTPFWETLVKNKLITQEKFKRLTRSTELTDDECAEFIDRQLVETRQSTKSIASILKNMYPNTKIVYSKAGNVNDFKQFFNNQNHLRNADAPDPFVKVRELNDLHHAKDAYLNIVVGNVYNAKFGYHGKDYIQKFGKNSYNLKRLYELPVNGAWQTGNQPTIAKVKYTFAKNTPLVTRMPLVKHTGFYHQNFVKHNNNIVYPMKENGKLSNASRYGGYDTVNTGKFVFVQYTEKGKLIKKLQPIPVIELQRMEQGQTTMAAFLEKVLQVKPVKILIPEIKLNSLFKVNGTFVYLVGYSGVRNIWNNANALVVSNKFENYLKKLVHYNKKLSEFWKTRKNDNKNDNKNANENSVSDQEIDESVLEQGENNEAKKKDKVYLSINDFDKITPQQNLELYDEFIRKFNMPTFKNLKYPAYGEVLSSAREKFVTLSVEKQAFTLFEILKLFQNSPEADLQCLDKKGSAHIASTQTINNTFTELKLIHPSITGLQQTQQDLLKM